MSGFFKLNNFVLPLCCQGKPEWSLCGQGKPEWPLCGQGKPEWPLCCQGKRLQPRAIKGLNIEGCRPTYTLPPSCDWYNIILAVDEPLVGITFDDVMEKVNKNKFKYIEQAIDGFDVDNYINQMTTIIQRVKGTNEYKNILVHVHQYTGTTIFDKTLQEKTKIKTILDTTNFFDTPIDYSKVYPEIDCLISISQCASMSLECKAGTLIVADDFMNFDVINNILYTAPINAVNKITKYLKDIPYVTGSVMVVNDLYNPSKYQIENEGVLLLDEADSKVLDFVKENTKIFDESHDWRHAVKVAYNSTRILNNKTVLYLALLHDVCDHKYPKSIKRELMTEYINTHLPEYKQIDAMIEQISFSKQAKTKDFSQVDPVLEAVRDGDRLEAIGEIGLTRCETFTRSIGGRVPQDVIIHCFDKLLRIVPEGYISTEIGKRLARKEHNIIVDYVNNLLPKYPELNYVTQVHL
jgi:uncharacterized protein